VGHEAGLFKKYGLEVEPILLRGSQVATQTLATSDPPIVNIGTVAQAGLQGHSLVLAAAVQSSYDFHVFTRPDITKPDQLKGKRLGITGVGSATHFASTLLLRHLNLESSKDVALVPSGLDPERVAAITAGRIDASFFTSIAAPLACKANLNELLYIGDPDGKQRDPNLRPHRRSSRDLNLDIGIFFQPFSTHPARFFPQPTPTGGIESNTIPSCWRNTIF